MILNYRRRVEGINLQDQAGVIYSKSGIAMDSPKSPETHINCGVRSAVGFTDPLIVENFPECNATFGLDELPD